MKTRQDQQTIVVGVDGSPASRAALRWAMNLTSTQESRVAVVAVQPRTPTFTPASSMAILPYGAAPATKPATRAERLHAVVGEHDDTVSEHLLTGNPARELARMARRGDLLVVGRDGWLGSVARSCIRHAQCPVVVVPAGPEE